MSLPLWLVLVGASCVVGGEALCLLGPLRYERIVHVICHAILYFGIASVALGAVLHWRGQSDAKQ